ncbi:MAG TPA: alpha/beta hydrolase-fold protein [Verrucomicrobiae bacterium]|nr:alpha/beta hydrolase-fold protein [Verrucomicrobiae bacterium]
MSALFLALLPVPLCRAALLETNLPSKFLPGPRTIHIYLPPSYDKDPTRRYPVLYLHDGQNVFTSAGTNIAFGWGNWALDKTADELVRSNQMREIIMVAVDSSRDRYEELNGRHHAADSTTNTPFENYTAFLITELKPQIDHAYRTLSDAPNTAIMGSSMGGIGSLILGWEHPETYGRVASLSGAFQVEHTNFLNGVLKEYAGPAKPLRIYLDSGVIDFTGGDDNRSLTGQVYAGLRRLNGTGNLMLFTDAKPLILGDLERAGLRRDKWAEAQTSQHNEFYWRLRAWRALTFLFPPAATMK